MTITSATATSAGVGRTVVRNVRSGKLFARSHVYVPSSASVTNISLLNLGEAVPPYAGVAINLLQSGALMMSSTTANQHVTTAAVLPRNRWVCLQLEVTVGDAGGVAIFVDGVERYRASGLDTLPAAGYSNVNFGVTWSQPGAPGVEVFVDEIAVDDARLPCG